MATILVTMQRARCCINQEIREKSCPFPIKGLRFPQLMTGMKLKTKAEPPPENRRLGYARVSTYGQTLDAQLEQLPAAGCISRNIYSRR